MDYSFKEFTIHQLVELIDKSQIDLNPSYQRNFIWSPDDQKSLIDTILLGYPLPNFFVYHDKGGAYEMVDGQQRSKTIFRFVKGLITSSRKTGNLKFENSAAAEILKYRLPFIVIENLTGKDSLRDFYVLINKKGVHLNLSEVNKSEFLDSNFLKLANEVLVYQNLIDLNLFSENSTKRMNDRAFVEELLSYLKLGIKEKKKSIQTIYGDDITSDEYNILRDSFYSVIDKIEKLNRIKPLSETRYKQKNDFYTLFSFIHTNEHLSQEVLNYQYQILLILDGVDEEGKQFIRPTNEDCPALREYANNCVSQSNSKNARDNRLSFFNSILKNSNLKHNEILTNVLNYFANIFGNKKVGLKNVGEFQLLDIDALKNK
ncbi:MAG: DUF262 domain-containing protein [Sediminibacterium sp.]|nr:DUF262 domain-containing protein [Sediminibacterium sp.]